MGFALDKNINAPMPPHAKGRGDGGRAAELRDTCIGKGLPEMKNRRTTLLWMKDLIEHMSRCHEQLQWADAGPSESFLTDAMLGDVSEFQKLCQELRTPPAPSRSLAPSA